MGGTFGQEVGCSEKDISLKFEDQDAFALFLDDFPFIDLTGHPAVILASRQYMFDHVDLAVAEHKKSDRYQQADCLPGHLLPPGTALPGRAEVQVAGVTVQGMAAAIVKYYPDLLAVASGEKTLADLD